METITGLAHTAAKAVWGDGTEHDEPASGVQGDVTKGEPYDGGNIDSHESKKRDSKFDTETNEQLKDHKHFEPAVETSISSKKASDDAAEHSTDPEMADSKQELKGAGPKPVAEVAKEHGGDAGNIGTESKTRSSKSDRAEITEAEDSKDKDKAGDEGTGEKYVKTSGLAADGGDFDATKPGAGREADRLMEQKGIHHEAGGDSKLSKPDSSSSGNGNKDGRDKPSMKERIKDKLHLHKS
ncbi:hypothetical protein QQS21_001077 [Conoideocrella luteorostrata]|uniref:Glycine-rich cell wall structural protein 1 n=1 Tax=Conoideocrella luteorostrata TaxID=1105319 RepID=A0AAJ0CXV3_9HYPO|nr:hypothetical protein QQS21_001077 [Conoideocrella luteorostrata]